MRRAAKVDDNHRTIVAALVKVGCLVQSLAGVGAGVPDLLVWSPFTKRLHLVEVKDGDKVPSAQKLTPAQQAWWEHWALASESMAVARSVDEALAIVGAKQEQR
jgi:hypothetical protein